MTFFFFFCLFVTSAVKIIKTSQQFGYSERGLVGTKKCLASCPNESLYVVGVLIFLPGRVGMQVKVCNVVDCGNSLESD